MPAVFDKPQFDYILEVMAARGLLDAPAPAAAQPSQAVESLLADIPFANDGDVITPDHHNLVVEALRRLAAATGDAQFERRMTLTFTPVLQADAESGDPAFRTLVGAAAGTDQGFGTGWMPLDLPNGTNIDTLTVHVASSTAIKLWTVSLKRVDLSGGNSVDVCLKEIQDEAEQQPRGVSIPVGVSLTGISPTTAAEHRRVNTDKYRYLFHTTFNGARASDTVQVRAVQVLCTRA